jgi:5-methylcytosine-specific restriction endonuclease McrA
VKKTCLQCGSEFEQPRLGRPKKYCSPQCVEKARKPSERRRKTQQAYAKEYYQRNKDKILKRNQDWIAARPNKPREYTAAYRERNPQTIISDREKTKKRRAENRDVYLENRREWRKNNPEKVRQWAKRNPDKVRINGRAGNHRRKARKLQVGGTYTRLEWENLLDKYGHRCLCCGATGVPLSSDHVVPLSRGGSNDISNIQPLCVPCNSKKHTKIVDYRIQWQSEAA